MRAILLGGGLLPDLHAARHPGRDPAAVHAAGYGQQIRDDGPTTPPHQARHARPWAALVIILSAVLGLLRWPS